MTAPGIGVEPPSVGAAYQHGLATLRRYFFELLLITVLWMLLSVPMGFSGGALSQVVVLAYQALVLWPVGLGAAYAFLEAARGRRPETGLLFIAFQRCYWPSVLAGFLSSVALTIGFALLVIPGIFLSVRLAFLPYLIVDEGLDPVEAFRESWRRTAPVGWTIFGVYLVAIPILIGGLLLLVVGLIPALVWVGLALAHLFLAATAHDRREPVIELGATP